MFAAGNVWAAGNSRRRCSLLESPHPIDRRVFLLKLGGPWNAAHREATGEGLSARALVADFAPLAEWLEKENRGRGIGWS